MIKLSIFKTILLLLCSWFNTFMITESWDHILTDIIYVYLCLILTKLVFIETCILGSFELPSNCYFFKIFVAMQFACGRTIKFNSVYQKLQ